METLLSLAFLACPVGMGLMMWFMGKGMRRTPGAPPLPGASHEQLREEHRRLGQEIERIERDGQGAPVAGRS